MIHNRQKAVDREMSRAADVSLLRARERRPWAKPDAMKIFWKLGWETGIEPATFGATDRRSTS